MMQQITTRWQLNRLAVKHLLLVLGVLLSHAAWAQTAPVYGNEWIVAGQPYYKVKVWRDGIYRLDYAYLSALGAGSVAPTQLQVWRRGKEVAVYQGGNQASLDASSYLEFYGQRNDGALDRDFYKNPNDQAHQYYSFYTDTAAYFITWGSRAGKRMEQPAAAGGTPHAWRIQTALKLAVDVYHQGPTDGTVHMPWLERGEGFFSGFFYNSPASIVNDSLLRAVATQTGVPPIIAELCFSGGSVPGGTGGPAGQHVTSVRIIPPGSAPRELGVLRYQGYDLAKARYQLQASDISSTGRVEISSTVVGQRTAPVFDFWRYSYLKITAPQQSVWFSNRRSLWFQNDSLLSGPATYELDNVPTTVVGYDIQDPWNVQRVTATASQTLGSTGRRFVFPNATTQQTRRLLLADAAAWLVPPTARRVNFKPLDRTKANFVIITHPKLMQGANGVPNAARAYADYRASVAGGRFDTLMVTAPQLYDQFHYGERSVLALRRFALWMAAAPTTQTKFLLLLGKGMGPGTVDGQDETLDYFGIGAGGTTRIQGEHGVDLVPTSTNSVSDNFLSSDWLNDDLVPKLPTGRVAATTPQEVLNYLEKLRVHEALGVEPWRKNVLHLVGGSNASDFQEFGGYLDKYALRVPRPLLGGRVTTYRKSGVDPVTAVNIATELNNGLGLITYFGHGSLKYFNLGIGDINDISTGYNNVGRYPIMMYNGCVAGDFSFNTSAFSTTWVLAQQKGALGMLAQSCESYAYLLDPAQDLMYQLMFNEPAWAGQPVAQVYSEAVRRLQANPLFKGNLAGTEQLLCTIWQGDPAFRLFVPAKPDFVASNATLSVAPAAGKTTITATEPFVLKIGMGNPARITTDSVEIRVTRTYPLSSGRPAEVILKTFRQTWARDTTYIVAIANMGNVYGDNTFKIELDYRNKVAELDETNNTATITYSFLKGGITQITPTEFAIVSSRTPQLTAQSNDPVATVRGYDFQVDTIATFNSPLLQQITNLSAPTNVSWQPTKPLIGAKSDSVVWYWRVRFSTPAAGEDGSWQTSSFRVIPSVTGGGWSQSHYAQLQRDQFQNVTVAAPNGRWRFPDSKLPVALSTTGGGGVGAGPTFNVTNGYGIRTSAAVLPYVRECGVSSPNLMLVVLDGRSARRVAVAGGPYNMCGTSGQTFYHFGSTSGDTLDNLNNSAARQQQLVTFLSNVPDGSYVALISMNRLRYAAFGPALRTALTTLLGSKLAASGQLRNGEGWALLAKKQAAGGVLVREQGPDRSLALPSYSQLVTLVDTVRTPGQTGQVLSTRIGPAKEWQTLFNDIRRETATSNYTLRVLGLDNTNATTVLRNDVTVKSSSLTDIPAATYPYLELELTLRDTVNRVPPQLKQWLITYKGIPEGVVRPDLVASSSYEPATLVAQATGSGKLSFPVKFQNIGGIDFAAPLTVQFDLVNASGTAVKTVSLTAPRILKADSIMTIQVSMDVVGVFGTLTPVVTVNPLKNRQPELYYFNNVLTLSPFTVSDGNLPPTLDVAFDGRHLLNGDLVSATPAISIQLKDEDKLRPIRKASNFTVLLQRPNQTNFTAIDVNSSEIQFMVDSTSQAGSVARLEYHPGKGTPLTDGIYTLQVQGRDGTGNSAGMQNYQVKFEVVSASTITNVFPYPNPVTSKARFVFTVTGQELPRNMKIQIMTLTGKVVREIFMGELGPLHIGNNITDYAWDGTDQYGDRLANGTYLYRVLLDDPNGTFSQRATAGDRAFKNDWGKLVLLR